MDRWKPNSRYGRAFAIVRVDSRAGMSTEPGVAITVKKVVRAQELAEAEVKRPNESNVGMGAAYFWTITRPDAPENR